VDEITAASGEQAQGIGQVNTAVAEMDKVVQQNAANAEESASASEEMTAQAGQMKNLVGELEALVGGRGNHRTAGAGRATTKMPQKTVGPNSYSNSGRNGNSKALRMDHAQEVDPEKLIPLGETDFKDF
jgi:methyl-accepting chemotaxis protein